MKNIFTLFKVFFFFFVFIFLGTNSIAQEKPDEKKKGVNIMITQSPKIFVKVEAVTHNVCNGESKGAVNITPSGGFPPYRYEWSNGETTQDIAGLKAGNYSVIVLDDFSCSDTVKVTVNQPEPLLAKVQSTTDILCYGQNNGEINISVSGGKAPYTYLWSSGAKTKDLKGVNSGHYSVLITDANACQEVLPADVLEKPLIVRWVDDVKNIKCNGDSTGSIDINVSGGVAPYTYKWSNGATTEDIRNVKGGNYQVVVKDAKGCTEVSVAKVVEPAALSVSFDQVRNLRCFGDNGGSINTIVKGGTQPYRFNWNNGSTTRDLAGITAGQYSLKVTDNNGCTKSVSQTVTEPTALGVTLANFSNIQFHGGKNGFIDIEVAGGIPPYKYRWSNGSEKQDLAGLEAGNYSVRVMDATGCAKIMNVTLTQPRPLVVQLDAVKNINCNGAQNGAIEISVAGGVAPFVYKWSHGDTKEDVSGLSAGNYTVAVTDANGHTQKIDATITEPPVFKAQVVSIGQILCNGQSSGSVDIKVDGGVMPYRYRWSNGQLSQDLINVPAGEYSVKISDANNCEQSLSAIVIQPEQLNVNLAKITPVNCNAETTGAIDITVTGGISPYKYKWSNGSITEDLNGIKAGDYSVVVTDSKGCVQEISAKITEPVVLVVREDIVKNVDCNANATGAISVNVAGGVSPYQFSWTNGSVTKDISGLKAGSYALKVTDANGCSKSYAKAITEPTKVIKKVDELKNVLCFDDAKGAINISVSGGVAPYRYKWSNGAVSQDIVDVKAGKYSVVLSDANGCVDSLSATVTQNPALVIKPDVTNISCFGQKSGSIALSTSGGIAPYTYKWSNGAITQNIAALGAGNYSVQVVDSKGCTKTAGAQIIEPSKFIAALESENDIKCFGETTGFINVRTSGGVTPYKYKWSNGDTTKNIAKVGAGSYTLIANDKNGCTQTVKTTLNQPTKTTYALKSISNVSCFGDKSGAIDIIVSGGVGPYSYKWSNGATTHDLDGVQAGKYTVQIADANGCSSSLSAEITQPALLNISLANLVNINCNGDKSGAIDIGVTGGVQPYRYSWSNGSVTQDITTLAAGNYSVTVTDAKGCSKSLNATVAQPPLLSAKLGIVKQIACFGEKTGSVAIEVAGGVQPYVFKWNNGATTQNLINVGAGTYSVDITDKNGCKQNLTAVINQPSKLNSVLTTAKNVTCFEGKDGAIDITVNGGIAPYKYAWSNGATTQDLIDISSGSYSVIITDANNCRDTTIKATLKQPSLLDVKISKVTHALKYGENTGSIVLAVAGGLPPYAYSWSNGSNSQNLTNIPGGNYTAKVKDGNGCEKTVGATIQQPPLLAVRIESIRDVSCNGEKTGSINIGVSGGVPPYKFDWSTGDSTMNIVNIGAGDYSLKVIDANGHHQSVIAKVAQPSAINIKLDILKDVNCFNEKSGAISVTVTGGIAPYRYQWNSGQNTDDISGIGAGDYELTVTDGTGCKAVLNAAVKQPDAFAATIAEVKHINCSGESKGSIGLEVKGGVTPYTYLWSNGSRSKDLTNVIAGQYNVRVTDAKGCLSNVNATINQPVPFITEVASVVNNLCNGDKSGSINLKVTGGTAPYRYTWNTGDSTQNISNIGKGDYSVSVSDSKGCNQRLVASITEPSAMVASLVETVNVNCFGEKTGRIMTDVSGGTTPYSYLWNNGQTRQNLTDIGAGDYQLTIKDSKGCSLILNAKIIEPKALTLNLDTLSHVACQGQNKGFVDVSVAGGSLPYVYNWSNGTKTEDLVNVLAGNYTLTVNDAKGCSKTLAATITEPEKLIVKPEGFKEIQCSGQETGEIAIAVSGGMQPYRYLWNNGSTAAKLTGLSAGEYVATVIDGNGCKEIYTAAISEPPLLIKTIDAITDIRCNGDSTGAVQVTVREGVAPYKFNWSNGSTTEDLRGLRAGNYSLVITEANGCKSKLEATVEEPTKFNSAIAKVTSVPCYGMATGAVEINVSGGIEPYTFAWSNGSKTKDIKNVQADAYSVIITDANGCSNILYPEIKEPPLLALHIDSVRNVKCCGDNSGAIFISVTGGVKPYNYQWSHGATTEDIQNLVLGVYTVNVTDANGCVVSTLDEMSLYEEVVSKGKFTTRDILFDVGKATIKPESFNTINRIASFMKEHPDLVFRIEGHTDSDGSDEFNLKLSDDRARAIRQALIKFGIRENRLQAKGYGETRPIATNLTVEGKSQNRRVEFITLSGTLDGTLESEINMVNQLD
jgi:outer membrane protein OmpA-like peptidoglycan-associated protein